MGMHNASNRLRSAIKALTKFYHMKHQELQAKEGTFAEDFDPDAEMWEGNEIDEPYFAYIEAMSEGIEELLVELKIKLDPIPPGHPKKMSCETLMAGARLLKWPVEVHDAETGQFIGRLEWAMYHRHDRFAVPGPAQISYIKARGGRTMMVG